MKVKLSPEYKSSKELQENIDSLDVSLYALKQLLQLSDKMLRMPEDEKTQALVDKLINQKKPNYLKGTQGTQGRKNAVNQSDKKKDMLMKMSSSLKTLTNEKMKKSATKTGSVGNLTAMSSTMH